MISFFHVIAEDIRAAINRDPAARSKLEVFFLYPGLHALWWHRVAHALWRRKRYFLARAISQANRFFTQIEIHPGAIIGKRLFIDHGAGVVIGETAEIGNDVLIYQGVVLGGTSLDKKKRHPTIGSNVVIGSRAIVLGPINVGAGARIGSGSVVIKPVPAGATVVGVPGRVVEERNAMYSTLDHNKLPDPVADVIRLVLLEQEKLTERIKSLEDHNDIVHRAEMVDSMRGKIICEFCNGEGI